MLLLASGVQRPICALPRLLRSAVASRVYGLGAPFVRRQIVGAVEEYRIDRFKRNKLADIYSPWKYCLPVALISSALNITYWSLANS